MRFRLSESTLRVVLVGALVAGIALPVAPVAQDDPITVPAAPVAHGDVEPVAMVAVDDPAALLPESAARKWYGWEILVADVASSLAITAGILSTDVGEAAVIEKEQDKPDGWLGLLCRLRNKGTHRRHSGRYLYLGATDLPTSFTDPRDGT